MDDAKAKHGKSLTDKKHGPRRVVNTGEALYQLLVKVLRTKHWQVAGERMGTPKTSVVSLQCSTPLLFLMCLDGLINFPGCEVRAQESCI